MQDLRPELLKESKRLGEYPVGRVWEKIGTGKLR